MAKSMLRTIFSFFLLGLIIISSTGFTMSVHYCQNNLKGISLFGEAKSCHEQKATCPLHQKEKKDDCCQNKTITFKSLDNDYNSVDVQIISNLSLNLPKEAEFELLKIHSPSNIYSSYIKYRPPPPTEDIQALFATYLI